MKTKNTVLFVISVLIIAGLAFWGAKGFTVAGYHFSSFGESINKGLDLKGGVSVLEEIQDEDVDQDTIDRTIELLNLRINKLGVGETVITQEGAKRIRIEIPGEYDTKKVVEEIAKTGKLTFRDPDGNVILEGSDVKDANAYLGQTGEPTIGLELNPDGAVKFSDATEEFIGKQISIYMDEDMVSNPTVNQQITDGSAIITGIDTIEEAQSEASIIKAGALPVTLETASAQLVSAQLGEEALPQSIKAGLIGIALIFIFMIIFYRMLGVIADIALVFFMTIVLGTFAKIGAVLTLSGIAGFLLTIGMAVDANVLIFERIKEELRAGKSMKTSIDSGFHRAMSSILDSNITTIIAGFV
ncbi:MAG: protein translocase subunit SecD, partial [Clostridiaceae bacterium]